MTYDRCHITDGCERDEACLYLCPSGRGDTGTPDRSDQTAEQEIGGRDA